MRGGKLPSILFILSLGAAGAASAEEVIHFTNGTYLSVRSHSVEGEMIRVELGRDAEMAFPITMVERIEVNGREVPLTPGSDSESASQPAGQPANQMVQGVERSDGAAPAENVNTRSYPVSGGARSARQRGDSRNGGAQARGADQPSGYITAGGRQQPPPRVARPFENHPNPNRRRISVVGNQALLDAAAEARGGGNQALEPSGAPGGRRKGIEFGAKSSPNDGAAGSESKTSGSGGDSSSKN